METKRICSRYGCTEGGENQRALCTIVGGPGRKDDGRTIKFGLKILGIDRSIYIICSCQHRAIAHLHILQCLILKVL